MPIQEEKIRDHLIGPKHAARHAAAHMHLCVFTNTPGTSSWRGANLGKFTRIFDLNGQPLFYDFPVLSPRREQVGMVRASASRVLGVPVLATYLGGPRWHTDSAILMARKYVEGKSKDSRIETKPVCYAYPRLGIEINWENRKEEAQRTIIDVGDFSVVAEKAEPGERGAGMSSFYDNLSGRLVPKALKSFASYDKLIEELQGRAGIDLSKFLSEDKSLAVQTCFAKIIRPFYKSKILTFCNHGHSHECFNLHPQPDLGYCVPATGQMILDFWRYYYSQNQIAGAMGTTTFYTTVPGEVNGLETLTCDHFDAQSDANPTFNKVMQEINANRPFDYSYNLHATACAGYRKTTIQILGTMPMQSVYLYDPWPNNIGSIRWETYGTISPDWGPVSWFIYLRRP